MREKKLSDFYWAYADILRGIGINESMYDQRIMAFMAVKLLIDNQKLSFTFEYDDNFGLTPTQYKKYKKEDTKNTFLNIIKHIEEFGQNLNFFTQDSELNPDASTNILTYLNHFKTFELERYIQELPNNYLENVLDIYIEKAHFVDYPKEQYKDLYEKTISRMKKLSGDLTGQHFTQKSIIHLMCEYVIDDLSKSNKDILAIYDPTCGTGSMLMESAHYFDEKINLNEKGNKKKKQKEITVYGQEMHGQTWLLCKIFLEICGINNKIAYGNTLTNPAFDKINGDNSFDFIIANPPFGVDWKHDYNEVVKNMQLGSKSNFYVIKDKKTNNIVTPKKSDGQFLFMQHIIKLLETSKKNKKHAKATIISSTGLLESGKEQSSEGKIREQIFRTKNIDVILEQPKNMFTNTAINTLIWFLNSEKNEISTNFIKLEKNKELYSELKHINDNMKYFYNENQINKIIKSFNKELKGISKKMIIQDTLPININSRLSLEDDFTKIVDFDKSMLDLLIEWINKRKVIKLKNGKILDIEEFKNIRLESVSLSDFCNEKSIKSKNNSDTIYSVTNKDMGKIVPENEVGKYTKRTKGTLGYKIIEKNDVVFNPTRINVGSIAIMDFEYGVISPMYEIFTIDQNIVNIDYFRLYVRSLIFKIFIKNHMGNQTRPSIKFQGLSTAMIYIPIDGEKFTSLEIQELICIFFEEMSSQIEIARNLINELENQYEDMLISLFKSN